MLHSHPVITTKRINKTAETHMNGLVLQTACDAQSD